MNKKLPDHSSRHIGQVLIFFLALIVLTAGAACADDWTAVDKTSDGIEIFKKEAGDSGFLVFRGVGVIEAPLPLVATLILNTDRRKEWIEGLGDSRIIDWEGRDDFLEYDHTELPFFIRDRDFVSRVTISSDSSGKRVVFHYQPAENSSAPHTKYIRGELTTIFKLDSFADNKTRVDAEFSCDPKGLIPKWLVNYFLGDWPKTTFRNLRKEALKPDISIDPHFSELTVKSSS